MTQQQTNVVYDSLHKIIDGHARLIESLSQGQPFSPNFKKAEQFIISHIKESATSYRRARLCEQSRQFVTPKETAIGLNWKSKFEITKNSEHHTLQQNTFQYVSIIETLQTLFQNTNFKQTYMHNEHCCAPNIFENFCCGKLYNRLNFFKENPNAIQVQLGIDDFEVAAPLKSKTTVHKMCAIYMQIMNLPQIYQSKLGGTM